MKTCSSCKIEKPIGGFHKNKAKKKGIQSACKVCCSERRRQWYSENSEIGRKRSQRWRSENPEKVREMNRQWYSENSEIGRKRSQRWRSENPEKAREKNRREVSGLTDSYIAGSLGISVKTAPPHLIEAKRLVLTLKRYIKNNEQHQ